MSGHANPCASCGRECAGKYCSVQCYRIAQRSQDTADRFWAKVRKGPGCWLWQGSRSGGRGGKRYGQFTYTVDGKQRHVGAHVFAYELAHGPVPDGLEVMHACNEGLCCRNGAGGHLMAGTHRQNVQDAARDGLYNVSRPNAQKVTDAQIAEMVAMRRSGLRLVQIAAHFDVTKGYVSMLVRGIRRQQPEAIERRRSA
jgi:hypothetical protein